MNLRSALLTFRIQRFEVVIVAGAAILSVLVSAVVIGLFTAGGYDRCTTGDSPEISALCQSPIALWTYRIARLSVAIVPVFPVVAGLLAGGPIVARELESGTARLAWSLGPSRLRWFVQRAAPVLLLATAACLAIGVTADALIHLTNPSLDLANTFVGFRTRGFLVGVEGLLVASIALAFGALLGRIVPTILLTLVLTGVLAIAIDKVDREMLTSQASIADGDAYAWNDESLYLDSRLRFPDGSMLTYNEAIATHPEIEQGWDDSSGIRNVVLYVPGTRYREIEARDAAIVAGLAGVFILVGAATVVRRRPR
jgi:hypothetical protein